MKLGLLVTENNVDKQTDKPTRFMFYKYSIGPVPDSNHVLHSCGHSIFSTELSQVTVEVSVLEQPHDHTTSLNQDVLYYIVLLALK